MSVQWRCRTEHMKMSCSWAQNHFEEQPDHSRHYSYCVRRKEEKVLAAAMMYITRLSCNLSYSLFFHWLDGKCIKHVNDGCNEELPIRWAEDPDRPILFQLPFCALMQNRLHSHHLSSSPDHHSQMEHFFQICGFIRLPSFSPSSPDHPNAYKPHSPQ